jgi:hypothetical protein
MNLTDTGAEQRTHAWLMARLGHATGSRFKDVIARKKPTEAQQKKNLPGDFMKVRTDYLVELAVERITGEPTQHFVNSYMQWGIDKEPVAKARYMEHTGHEVEEVGFIRHPDLHAGVSPDGLVPLEGAIEIKCPSSANHLATLREGMPDDHMAQVQGCMWVTGAAWLDFISFDPRFPRGLDLYVQRIHRDEKFISALEAEVRLFLAELDEITASLKERMQ